MAGVGTWRIDFYNHNLALPCPATQLAPPLESQVMTIQRSPFGKTADGTKVELFTLTNAADNAIKLTNYGAILVSVEVPDRRGRRANVTMGYQDLTGYLTRHPYFGSTVGRFANRIASGQFSLDGKNYNLAVNNGPNHLHGGIEGFDRLVWEAEELHSPGVVGMRFKLLSPDGQEGYPGNLSVLLEMTWNDASELRMVYRATTDQATVLNLTNHSYWNLAGVGSGQIYDHELQLDCDQFLPVDQSQIPTGELRSVVGTCFDFRQPHKIGQRMDQLPATQGYDHCFVVNGEAGALRRCAFVKDASSGRAMEVLTTQPGVQLYTGNNLERPHLQHEAFCLETQHFPDSPNQPQFPSTRLESGEQFEEITLHRFSVD